MKFALLILLLFFPLFVKADGVRWRDSFKSKNSKYELRLITKYPQEQKWALIEKKTKKTLYELTEWLSSMTVYVSNDGKNLVALDDFSQSFRKNNPEVLRFYLNGRLTKAYKLDQLMDNPTNVSQSVSHFEWLIEFPEFIPSTEKLSLTTYELNSYEFDIKNGEILQKKRDSQLSEDAIYAYGGIEKLENGNFDLKIECLIYGKMPENKTIKFKAEPDSLLDKYNYALIIKNGQLISKINIILNVCVEK